MLNRAISCVNIHLHMTIAIYYFSGTGNTLCVAKDIAAQTGGTLIPVASLMNRDFIEIDAEVIGIIFPVYYNELPLIIKRFTGKLDNLEHKYIFAVCTFGGSAGNSLKSLRQLIGARRGILSATYRVHMPQNSFRKFFENHAMLYSTWNKQVGQVVWNTNNRKQGEFFKHVLLRPFFVLVDYSLNNMQAMYRKSFAKLSNSSPDLKMDDLIQLNDMSFSVFENCNGCGTCAKVCPVNNIVITEKKPVWQHHCENCLACYNWCPVKAIRGGIAAKNYYYRHPEIKVTEMMKQKIDPASAQTN
jgi:ferredoxin/flavodoxin